MPQAKLEYVCDGYEISITGYGTKPVNGDSFPPIWLDVKGEEPILYVWADAARADYTHRILLGKAKIEKGT